MCTMLFLFTEFIAEFESTWAIILKQLFAGGEGTIDEEYSLHLQQIFVNFYLLCNFTILGQWNMQNMPWLYTVKQG